MSALQVIKFRIRGYSPGDQKLNRHVTTGVLKFHAQWSTLIGHMNGRLKPDQFVSIYTDGRQMY